MAKRFWAFSIFALLLSACTLTSMNSDLSDTAHEYNNHVVLRSDESVGCLAIFDDYCDFLYSPSASGNLRLSRGKDSVLVLQGQTRNDFSAVEYAYNKAKIRYASLLPRDFADALESQNYFPRLKQLLARPPREQMSLSDRLGFEKIESNLEQTWVHALNETVLRRLEKRSPGYHKLKDDLIPIEMRLEKRRVRRQLISDISKSIWRRDPNWLKVEKNFEQIRQNYLKTIAKLDVPDDLQNDWKSRIESVRLVLPGSMPELADEECATTKSNAYYYPNFNVITVCAGDFNSEEILQTLAHEMSHVLDTHRSTLMDQQKSHIGRDTLQLREQVCQPLHFNCADWTKYKRNFALSLNELGSYQHPLNDFLACLQPRPIKEVEREDVLARVARTEINQRFSELAEADVFLRLTKQQIPSTKRRNFKNPNYLNPCNYSVLSTGDEPIEDELTSLVFFVAEYRCQSEDSELKFKNAIEVAKQMSQDLFEKILSHEGKYSSRSELEREGWASSPDERFADTMGSYVFANLLTEIEKPADRRSVFLGNNSWQCTPPSLKSFFPYESRVQRDYVYESHTEGDTRLKEILNRPIREALSCQKDFDFHACELKFKK